ncbi:MAG: TetR family transcriptional regulator [Chloroflexi bacterium]|nr:TetR family transcriptional regulator [Chloroflexota bacterium]
MDAHGIAETPPLSAPDRIRAAATELLRVRGYSATSMRDLATMVGMTVGSLYNHFVSKQALLYDILLSAHTDALAALDAALVADPAPPVALRQAVRSHVMFHIHHPAAVAVVYRDIDFLSPEQIRTIVGLRRAYEARIVGLIVAGAEQGVFQPLDPSLSTIALISMGIRVAAWYRPGGRLSADEIADRYGAYALRLVGCSSQA